MSNHWILPDSEASTNTASDSIVAELARFLRCTHPIASLLFRKGITSPEQADAFLNPKLKTLSDPFLLPDMRRAVDRVMTAIDRRERIVLFGDYDVDGVTSLALLSRMLHAYDAKPECFLPLRAGEGYGLTAEGIARCMTTLRPQLLIAVDCGTSSAAEIAQLSVSGVDVVILDHHECKADLPDCIAVVNPKRTDATSSDYADFRYLCSAGLVFKLCHALLKTRPAIGEFVLREHLDMVALATIADIVPLVLENRILVQKGLEQMANTRWPGLRALLDVAGVVMPITPTQVGFQLGPRLNASGRLGTAQNSLELLLTDDPGRARTLALELDAQNRDRQQVEKKTVHEAEERLDFDPKRDSAIVIGAPGWHQGVLGIVASRFCKKHHRPTLVIGFDENGVGKGSGRSIDGLSLVEALGRCSHLLERFGGHEMAAGVTIRHERFEEFQQAFRLTARELLADDDLIPRVKLDAELSLETVDFDFLLLHEKLQPFGAGNAQPVFLASGVHPAATPVVIKEKHLRLTLIQNGVRHEAIFFNGAIEPLPRPPWDIAFRIERNQWRERVTVQIQIQRIRTAEGQ